MRGVQKLAWATAVAALAFAATASAADLPTKKQPPAPYVPPPPPFSWTGFYVGATVGGIWGSGNASVAATYGGTTLGSAYIPTSLGAGTSGWEGGGEVGYNFQSGMAVFGIEDDLQWLSNSMSVTRSGAALPAPVGGNLTTTASANMNWLGTTRLRLGLATLADQRLLLYTTGGLAYGGGSASINATAPGGFSWSGSGGATQVGWTVGLGAEYAFTNNWTVKGEYLYYNLSSYNYFTSPNLVAAGSGLALSSRVTPEGSIFRVGLNYKF